MQLPVCNFDLKEMEEEVSLAGTGDGPMEGQEHKCHHKSLTKSIWCPTGQLLLTTQPAMSHPLLAFLALEPPLLAFSALEPPFACFLCTGATLCLLFLCWNHPLLAFFALEPPFACFFCTGATLCLLFVDDHHFAVEAQDCELLFAGGTVVMARIG